MTLNEPQCAAFLGYGIGIHAPGWKLGDADVALALHNMALAHSAAQRAIKDVSPDAAVGVVSCGALFYPRNDTPPDAKPRTEPPSTFPTSIGP